MGIASIPTPQRPLQHLESFQGAEKGFAGTGDRHELKTFVFLNSITTCVLRNPGISYVLVIINQTMICLFKI